MTGGGADLDRDLKDHDLTNDPGPVEEDPVHDHGHVDIVAHDQDPGDPAQDLGNGRGELSLLQVYLIVKSVSHVMV